MGNLNSSKEIGQIGENSICNFLIENGWSILFRNYKEKVGEIDIIARTNDNLIVFCEVKSRLKIGSSDVAIRPEDNLTTSKARKMLRACRLFEARHPEYFYGGKGWRMDLFAVDIGINGTVREIRHYENI